jgi:phage terminase large subunit
VLEGLGCKVQLIPRSDPEARIRAARMMFPRVYIDTRKHETPPERPDRLLGAGNLLDRLRRYKRVVPATTLEPSGPAHDINSHGADAYGGLAEIVDRIRNDGDMPQVRVPAGRRVRVWGRRICIRSPSHPSKPATSASL